MSWLGPAGIFRGIPSWLHHKLLPVAFLFCTAVKYVISTWYPKPITFKLFAYFIWIASFYFFACHIVGITILNVLLNGVYVKWGKCNWLPHVAFSGRNKSSQRNSNGNRNRLHTSLYQLVFMHHFRGSEYLGTWALHTSRRSPIHILLQQKNLSVFLSSIAIQCRLSTRTYIVCQYIWTSLLMHTK